MEDCGRKVAWCFKGRGDWGTNKIWLLDTDNVGSSVLLLVKKVTPSGYKIKITSGSSHRGPYHEFCQFQLVFFSWFTLHFRRWRQTQRAEPTRPLNHETHHGKWQGQEPPRLTYSCSEWAHSEQPRPPSSVLSLKPATDGILLGNMIERDYIPQSQICGVCFYDAMAVAKDFCWKSWYLRNGFVLVRDRKESW